MLAHFFCTFSSKTNHYYVDSKKLPVCDNRRIHSNRVFEEIASRGRDFPGWFYGLDSHA
uniref:transposase n=1 Tax=Nafulsella turpanensis TaxID=1265690 RepID=UPI00135F177A